MSRPSRCLALLSLLALVSLACRLAGEITAPPAGPGHTATASFDSATPEFVITPGGVTLPTPTHIPPTASPVPSAAHTPATAGPTPTARPKPPQSQAAEIRPTEMRTALTRLSELIGYQILDENGEPLGQASDYIVNTCETYIIYILMTPEAGLGFASEQRVVIPYEAVTVNSGLLDAAQKAIHLRLLPGQLLGAPVFPAGQPLTPTGWEAAVREFWSRVVRIGSLSTACNVPGGPVYKVALASQLLAARLYDGRGEPLGEIQEAILAPESGKLAFYVVRPARGEGWVMVRLAVTNIPREALEPGGALRLVLLSEPELFWDAPRLTALEEAESFSMQGKMLQYWGR